ncbi:MAG TPA: class I SAM-dependent methyltransferase [Candidatus Nitrosotalea sp.]|jgi:SAM-dependent methyltransferase|nr:class I SAM-dependent methyltransferase [Candidatus Nitrosotalea sp.]
MDKPKPNPTPNPTQASTLRTAHWQGVYGSKAETQVSWFEASPALSLELMAEAGFAIDIPVAVDGPPRRDTAIIDIGGGAARLVDALLQRGYRDLSVLDISAAALATARQRLVRDPGLREAASRVSWIAADVTRWQPDRSYDLWHDRAALHFLTDPAEQQAYRAALAAALRPCSGIAIIGTFAPDGPERCSNLPVQRHDAESLASLLGPGFELLATRRHDHATPWGAVQHFQFSTFRRCC